MESRAFKVVGVCSNPRAESVWWKSNEIARYCARDKGLPFISNETKDDEAVLDLVERTGANVVISVQHHHILSRTVLEAVGYQALNMHNAKLPDYRGCNAVNHALLNGDKSFTSTIHWMIPEVDKGDIAFEETIEVREDDTARSLYCRAARSGISAFNTLLKCLLTGAEIPRRPVGRGGAYHRRSSIERLKEIRDIGDDEEVDCKSRAFYFPPFEPAYFVRGGKKLHVLPTAAWMTGHDPVIDQGWSIW